MNTAQSISRESFTLDNLFFESPIRTGYLWKNLIIEERISMNWIHKLRRVFQ
jgi:hypothetical protein